MCKRIVGYDPIEDLYIVRPMTEEEYERAIDFERWLFDRQTERLDDETRQTKQATTGTSD